eukprot:9329033-Karenia_brevis.AAC.1
MISVEIPAGYTRRQTMHKLHHFTIRMLHEIESEAHKQHFDVYCAKKERGSFNAMVQEAQKEFEEATNKSRESILDVQHPPLPSAQ